MIKTILTVLFVVFLLSVKQTSFGQQRKLDSLFAKGDTTAVMDSLMMGFDAFLDSLVQPRSFFSAGAGMGNRTFSIKNNALNTQEATTRQLSFTPTLGYYHKRGAGISVTGFAANLNNNFHFYHFIIFWWRQRRWKLHEQKRFTWFRWCPAMVLIRKYVGWR